MTTTAAKPRRVLMVAYYFPPISTSGTFRTLKFVKYLPEFGWEPVVLTVDARHEPLEPKSDELLAQIPATTHVIRTYAWNPLKVLTGSRSTVAAEQRTAEQTTPTTANTPARSWRRRLRDWLLFPDRCSGWFPFAVAGGLRAIRQYDVEVIYSSGPPYTATVVALVLSRLTGKPLISDFRDPWAVNTYRGSADGRPVTRKQRWAQVLERKTFQHSARILNISDELTAKARASAPSDWAAKFVTIYNGFDPADFPVPPTGRPAAAGRFRAVYTGCFYAGSREPTNFLRALRLWADRHPADFRSVEVWFVGDPGWAEAHTPQWRGLGLNSHVQFKPFLPHRENLQLLAESDLLLMIGSIKKADTGSLPVKTFEYAAAQRPILALVHEGESARFVRGCGIGRVADPEDPEEIARVFDEMYRDIRAGTFPTKANADFLRRYDRRELTRQLAAVFDGVVAARN